MPFAALGVGETTLHGPFDSRGWVFGLPAAWELTSDAELQLSISVIGVIPGHSSTTPPPGSPITSTLLGTLSVQLNGVNLRPIQIDNRPDRTVTVPITPTALLSNRSDGRHSIEIMLNSAVNCLYDPQTTVVVHPSSRLVLPHRDGSPPTDLRSLPRPLYQGSFIQDEAVLIVPDKPSEGDLQAAMTVAAGLGRMSNNKIKIGILPLANVTEQIRQTKNLIVIGSPSSFVFLAGLTLPAPVNRSTYKVDGLNQGDGVIQMVVSPFNPGRVLLLIGGDNDAATVKAAQAVSSGKVRPAAQANVAIVADVRTGLSPVANQPVDRTLGDLGFGTVVLKNVGINLTEYTVSMPSNQSLTNDAYVDLVFNHSTLLNYERSGLVVIANDEPIGSIRFNDETAKSGKLRVQIPRSAFHGGTNRLTIEADLLPNVVCIDPRINSVFVTLRPESALHLPVAPVQNVINRNYDLQYFPGMMTQAPQLSNVAFILSPDDPSGWSTAAGLASAIGDRAGGRFDEPLVAWGSAISQEIRQSRDLVIVGRPSTLPIINELGSALPATFDPATDLASEQGTQIMYRQPTGSDIGYVGVIPAPWNPQRAVLTVLGTSTAGVESAGNVLSNPRLHSLLSGNWAVVAGEQITTPELRKEVGNPNNATTPLPANLSAPVATPRAVVSRPWWLMPAIGLTLGLMALTITVVLAGRVRRRRTSA
ncbi:MAG: hypothetical protein NVSMB42_21460 [Herpetosiphon sp.]